MICVASSQLGCDLGQMQKVAVGTAHLVPLMTFSDYFSHRPGCLPFSITHKDLLNDDMLECSLGKASLL